MFAKNNLSFEKSDPNENRSQVNATAVQSC
jgi:hypothetical protein